jgi:cytochrome P450
MTSRPTISGHAAVRAALRDTETYSSDLQGDADVRDYRQIPLEVDPPSHHSYREALAPMFVKPRIESLVPNFQRNAIRILDEYEAAGGGDFIRDVALNYVVTCLGDIFNRPQDVAEWMSWGAAVWEADGNGRSGDRLHEYLRRVFDEAQTSDVDDVWTFIAQLHINEQPMTFEQFMGIGSVSLAGGRDTVVKLITGSTWHLITSSTNRAMLLSGEVEMKKAIQELLRYFTPLPGMLRVPPEQQSLSDVERNPDTFTEISFLSANFDETVFAAPDVIDFTRARIPHVAFGFGPHTCIGNAIAEIETEVLLSELVGRLDAWSLVADPEIEWTDVSGYRFPNAFHTMQCSVVSPAKTEV